MRRTKAEADETRLRIIESAELLFFQRGVSETTLDQIARSAGVTRGAFYHHFKDKTDLLREIFEAVPLPYEHLSQIECDRGSADPFGAIEQAVAIAIRQFASDVRQQRVYAILTRVGLPDSVAQDAMRQIGDAYHQQREELIAILTYAEEMGQMCPIWTPESAEAVLSNWLKGVYDDWLMTERAFDLTVEATDQMRRLLASFRKNAPAADSRRMA